MGSISGLIQWVKDTTLLWLWCRLTAAVLIQLLAWELPYATGAALIRQKEKEKKKKKKLKKSSYSTCRAPHDMYTQASLASSPATPSLTPGWATYSKHTPTPQPLHLLLPLPETHSLRCPNVLTVGNYEPSSNLVFPSHPDVFFSQHC